MFCEMIVIIKLICISITYLTYFSFAMRMLQIYSEISSLHYIANNIVFKDSVFERQSDKERGRERERGKERREREKERKGEGENERGREREYLLSVGSYLTGCSSQV